MVVNPEIFGPGSFSSYTMRAPGSQEKGGEEIVRNDGHKVRQWNQFTSYCSPPKYLISKDSPDQPFVLSLNFVAS